jgi:hypothetical protein
MQTEILQGTEKRLYEIVGPLAMNPDILRQNDNVAFKTSKNHVYFIALDDNENCIGFIPVQKKGNKKRPKGEINNYYIQDRNPKILSGLIKLAQQHSKKEKFELLTIIAQSPDYETVLKLKFFVEKSFVKNTRFTKKL